MQQRRKKYILTVAVAPGMFVTIFHFPGFNYNLSRVIENFNELIISRHTSSEENLQTKLRLDIMLIVLIFHKGFVDDLFYFKLLTDY